MDGGTIYGVILMKRVLTAAALGTAAVLAFGTANAEPYEMGILECSALGEQGLVTAESELTCTFEPSITERESEAYAGMIGGAAGTQSMSAGIGSGTSTGGASSGVSTEDREMSGLVAWRVFAFGPDLPQGALAGEYAPAASGQDAPANALVGGAGNSILLLPVSGQSVASASQVSHLTLDWPN